MKAARILLKETFIYGSSDLFFKIIAFLTFPLFAHAFSSAEYGLLALVITVGTLISSCFTCGLNHAAQIRYAHIDKEKITYSNPLVVTTGLFSMLILGLVTVGCCVGCAYAYQEMLFSYSQIKWSWIAWGLCGNLFIMITNFAVDIIRLHFAAWKFVCISALLNTLSIIGNLIAVFYFHSGIEGFLISNAVANFLLIPLSLWMIRKDLLISFNWTLSKELLSAGYPFIFVGVATALFGTMDRWILEALSNLHEVGIYSIAFKCVSIITLFSYAVGHAWIPRALNMYRDDPSYRNTFSGLFHFAFYAFVLFAAAISLFSTEFLMLTTPQEYWPAAGLMPFLSMGLACYGASQMLSLIFSMKKKSYHMAIAFSLATLCNCLFAILLIPNYGALGAAIATCIAYVALSTYSWYWSQKIHQLPLEYSKLAITILSMLLLIVFHVWLQTIPWGVITVFIKISLLVSFIAVGYMLKIIPKLSLLFSFN